MVGNQEEERKSVYFSRQKNVKGGVLIFVVADIWNCYNMDMFGESIEGHKYKTPYQAVKMINPNSKEDMELLREVLRNNHFDDEDE